MDFSIATKHKRIKHKIILLIVYSILCLLLIISIFNEVIYGNSFFSRCWPGIRCPLFLQASAIFETISIIGFSSLLIGLIYANLDKTIIGLEYSEILRIKFPFYKGFSLIHIFATVICIITSASNTSESAAISFAIVIVGFVYQWVVFIRLVVNKDNCLRLAKECWMSECQNPLKTYYCLKRLAETLLSTDSKYYNDHVYSLSYSFYEYAKKYNCVSDLEKMVYIWRYLFCGKEEHNRGEIAQDIFSCLLNGIRCSTDETKNCVCSIASGYIVYEINWNLKTEQDIDLEKAFVMFYRKMIVVMNKVASSENTNINTSLKDYMFNCIKTNLYCVFWFYVLSGVVPANRELLKIAPTRKCDINQKYVKKCITLLNLPIAKDKRKHINRISDISIRQLRYQLRSKV